MARGCEFFLFVLRLFYFYLLCFGVVVPVFFVAFCFGVLFGFLGVDQHEMANVWLSFRAGGGSLACD